MTDFDKWQIAEARCEDLRKRCELTERALSHLVYAATGGNAINGNVKAFRHAADRLDQLGSTEADFISALRERATMLEIALANAALLEDIDD